MASKKCEKLFRDPVHNVIHFNVGNDIEALLLRLIDSEPVQRLRHIKQLGLASFVYHGAEHSRFGHSLGTVHMARRLYESASAQRASSDFDRAVLLCSALLHDVGHAPFSHAFETSMQSIYAFKHESISEALVLWEQGEVFGILNDFDKALPQELAACIGHRSRQWFSAIVSSQLDADRMDYILRDGHMTGVKNYLYDADRIIEMLDRDECGPLVGSRAIQAVESYLLSRFHMYQQVYHHKAVRGGEKLVEAIFKRIAHLHRLGNDEALACGPMGEVLRDFLESKALNPAHYLRVNDNHAWYAIDYWSLCSDGVLSDLAQRLRGRRFFKTVEITGERLPLFHRYFSQVQDICRENGFDPEYYVSLDSTQNRAFAPYAPQSGPRLPFFAQDSAPNPNDDIRIAQGDGSVVSIMEASPIVRMLTEVSSHTVRCCFPDSLRAALQSFFKDKHIIA